MIILRCNDKQECLVAEKDEYGWNFSIQDSFIYKNNYVGIKGRIKKAINILFGKPIYYADICPNNEDVKVFFEQLSKEINNT